MTTARNLPPVRIWRRILLMGFLVVLCLPDPSRGQLFGTRQLGRSLSRRDRSGASTGTIRNQRFLRANRGRGRFVGRATAERGGFVGVTQSGGGSQRSAVSGASPSARPNVNQAYSRPPASRPYAARLQVGFAHQPMSDALVNEQIQQRLSSLPGQISVSLADRTATLQGTVASESARQLAEILTRFEPGVSAVQNDLQVVVEDPESERVPPVPRAPTSPALGR